MLKKLLNKIGSWFKSEESTQTLLKQQSKVKMGDKVGNITIAHDYQLIKHTDYKVGDSYLLGEMIVTLHDSKASAQRAIAKVEARRLAKEKRLTERAIDLMLMTPEQLMELKLSEWLEKRNKGQSIVQAIMGRFMGKRYTPPVDKLPSGSKQERFEELTKEIKEKEKLPV